MTAGPDGERSSPRARLDWIDGARGIGIALVVYGHVMRGLVTTRIAPEDAFYRLGDGLIYAFHMPLFFLISGMVARRVAAGGRGDFVAGRLRMIAYPYLLWSLVQGLLAMAAHDAVNHPVAPAALVSILWRPLAEFWFLYALLLVQLTLLLPGRWTMAALVPIGMLLVLRFGIVPMPLTAASELPFFALGFYAGGPLRALTRGRAATLAALGWIVFVPCVIALLRDGTLPSMIALRWCTGFSGGLAMLGTARLIAPHLPLLAALGRASMPIYLLHTIACAALRTALLGLGISLPLVVWVILLTVAGLAIPFVAQRIAARFDLETWLGFGRTGHGPARLASAPGGMAVATGERSA